MLIFTEVEELSDIGIQSNWTRFAFRTEEVSAFAEDGINSIIFINGLEYKVSLSYEELLDNFRIANSPIRDFFLN